MPKHIACHYQRPFIDRYGDLYPCCFKNRDSSFRIGNIEDKNILPKMESFDIKCCCDFYIFKKYSNEKMRQLAIQTSLQCHGKCAVCYVSAPLKKENIEINYDNAFRIIEIFRPQTLQLEGGEIPILKKSMEFAKYVRVNIDNMHMKLLTNGCYNIEVAKKLAKIFDSIDISFMGKRKETYYMETLLDISKTEQFVQELYNQNIRLSLRFICTPLTLMDIACFLSYATQFKNVSIWYGDCGLESYVHNHPTIPYWNQIIRRCQTIFREALLCNRDTIVNNANTVLIHPRTARLLNITQKTIDMFKLNNVKIR